MTSRGVTSLNNLIQYPSGDWQDHMGGLEEDIGKNEREKIIHDMGTKLVVIVKRLGKTNRSNPRLRKKKKI